MLTCFLKKPGTAGFFRGRSRLQYMGQHGIKNLLSQYASVCVSNYNIDKIHCLPVML